MEHISTIIGRIMDQLELERTVDSLLANWPVKELTDWDKDMLAGLLKAMVKNGHEGGDLFEIMELMTDRRQDWGANQAMVFFLATADRLRQEKGA
jgi:hypothetical protein